MKISHLTFIGISALVLPAIALASFGDVSSNHPNADAIGYVQSQGIVSGYPDGTFKPDQPINRAEFTKILISSHYTMEEVYEGLKKENRPHMSDVEHASWYENYVHFARFQGIIEGYPDGTFRPAANINFVEAAKIISVVSLGFSPVPLEPLEGQPWYRTFVEGLEQYNAIPTSIHALDQAITRGEMAEIIYRLKANITTKTSKTYANLEPEMMSVYVYLYNGADKFSPCDSGYDCDHLYERSEILVPRTKSVLKSSLQALLDMGVESGCDGSGTCSDLYLSDLRVTYATIVDGVAHVRIEGNVALAGDMSGTRAVEEIRRTVMQFPSVKSADITVNGRSLKCLADLSGMCE